MLGHLKSICGRECSAAPPPAAADGKNCHSCGHTFINPTHCRHLRTLCSAQWRARRLVRRHRQRRGLIREVGGRLSRASLRGRWQHFSLVPPRQCEKRRLEQQAAEKGQAPLRQRRSARRQTSCERSPRLATRRLAGIWPRTWHTLSGRRKNLVRQQAMRVKP